MTYYKAAATLIPAGGGSFTLTNISSVSFSWGRQNFMDDYSGISVTLYGYNPSGWTLKPQVNDVVSLRLNTTTDSWLLSETALFQYNNAMRLKVVDYTVRYGLKQELDTWELTLEGFFANQSRGYLSWTTTAGASTYAFADALASLGASWTANPNGWRTTTSAQTYTDTTNTLVQLILRNDGGWVKESFYNTFTGDVGVTVNGGNIRNSNAFEYSDVPVENKYRYSEIVFRSAASNYSSKVTVVPSGLAQQTAGSGDFAYQVDTINSTTTEAANLAGWYQTILNLTTAVPFTITSSGALSTNTMPDVFDPAMNMSTVSIKFRGTTYKCVVIGAEFSMDGSDWSGTAYLIGDAAYSWFVLDSTTFGILDTNKLGF